MSTSDNSIDVKEKLKLKEEIEKLKIYHKQVEYSLAAVRFKSCSKHYQEADESEDNDTLREEIRRISDLCELDMHKLAGLYCYEANEDHIVYHLHSGHIIKQETTYMVEFLINDGIPKIGKYFLPPSINMNDLRAEIPLNTAKGMPLFLKTCKSYIHTYNKRCTEFQSLKAHMKQIKNCSVQSNMSFTNIIIEFLKVRDIENDSLLNLKVYLLYKKNEARPHKIQIEDKFGNELSAEVVNRLGVSLAPLKLHDLKPGFDEIFTECNGSFVWIRISADNDPITEDDFDESSVSSVDVTNPNVSRFTNSLSQKTPTRSRTKRTKKAHLRKNKKAKLPKDFKGTV